MCNGFTECNSYTIQFIHIEYLHIVYSHSCITITSNFIEIFQLLNVSSNVLEMKDKPPPQKKRYIYYFHLACGLLIDGIDKKRKKNHHISLALSEIITSRIELEHTQK